MGKILNASLHGDVVVIIPAKVSSQGITRKFETDILGKPAIMWSVKAALECADVSDVWVMQNHPDIGKFVTKRLSEEELKRVRFVGDPPGDAVMDHKIYELLNKHRVTADQVVVLLQPTTPLVRPKHISAAIAMWRNQPLGSSVISGRREPGFRWFKGRGRNSFYTTRDYDPQDRPVRQRRQYIFMEDGALYVSAAGVWLTTRCRMGAWVMVYPLAAHYSVELDEPDDVLVVRAVAKFLYGDDDAEDV